jgi:hypothetical protein
VIVLLSHGVPPFPGKGKPGPDKNMLDFRHH